MKIAKHKRGPEIFYSLQGEGRNLGRPSIFVRASLCNLHCVWCDTDYTWNWEGTRFKHLNDKNPGYKKFRMEEQIVEMTPDALIPEIRKYPCKNLVLTGGEPLMQQPDWVRLMQMLRVFDPAYQFEVETNGTLRPSTAFDSLIDQYNVSPKLANSGNKPDLRDKPKVMAFFAKSPKAWFKFVIARKADLKEVLGLIGKYQIPSDRVYLMPEGTTSDQLQKNRKWLFEACMKHGLLFTDRLHVHVYGDKRGV